MLARLMFWLIDGLRWSVEYVDALPGWVDYVLFFGAIVGAFGLRLWWIDYQRRMGTLRVGARSEWVP